MTPTGAQPAAHQIGNARLCHTNQLGSFCLRQLSFLHHCDDFMRKLGTKHCYSATSADQLPHMLAALLMFAWARRDRRLKVIPAVERELVIFGAEFFGAGLEIVPGGAYILAAALQRLGVHVRWHTRLGNDLFSRFVYEEAQHEGLDTALFEIIDRPLRSVSVSFSFVHDRGFISYIDAFEPLDLLTILRDHRPRSVLLGGLEYSPAFLEFAAAARQMGSKLLMDCQHRQATLETPGVIEALQAVDAFMPNQGEACRLTGLSDVEEAARQLARFTPLVVVKLGAEGALAAQGEQITRAPAIHAGQVVDTTGAGDCFNAGFLYGYLKGESVETCLRYANLLGGISVTGHGVSQIPAREQVESLLAQYDALVEGEIDLPRQPGLGWSFKVKR